MKRRNVSCGRKRESFAFVVRWLTSIAQLKFDDRSARSLPHFGRGRNPGLVGFAQLQTSRLVVQVLLRQRIFSDLHLLALVQHPNIDGVFGKDSVWSPWRQPRYYHCVFVTDHSFHALRRVRN